jgi:hypothetical protein
MRKTRRTSMHSFIWATNARPASSSFRSASEQAVSELVESAAHGDRGHGWEVVLGAGAAILSLLSRYSTHCSQRA